MNGQLKLKKYTGLAAIVSSLSIGAYQIAQMSNYDNGNFTPTEYIAYSSAGVLGGYAVGHYNGMRKGYKWMKRRYKKGLRYEHD